MPELIEAGLLNKDQAEKIRRYYEQKEDRSGNRTLIVFGTLGAILVGLGIILIVAHNWDELSRPLKVFFAFLPLVLGQLACFYVLWRRFDEVVWREGAATFLFLALGACLSMISQIYNISGQISDLLWLWMLLALPLIYLLRSSIASLLYWTGITYYACQQAYVEYPTAVPYWYWLFILPALPHYFLLIKNKPESNFTIFHHWIIPLSLIISLGSFGQNEELLMFLAYFSLFGWLYLIGRLAYFEDQNLINNGFLILGSLGSVIILLMLSFDFFWEELYRQRDDFWTWTGLPEFYVCLILTLLAGGFLYRLVRHQPAHGWGLMDILFLLFLFVFGTGVNAPGQALVAVNLLLFLLGIFYIRRGARLDHLGILNYGLLIITALIICRFFDTKFSFILRGSLFVLVGIGFFAANYLMLKKRKQTDQS